MVTERATVVLLAGLPASGKTTMAEWLHARMGGRLIRSCDVYQALGIDLPAWVRRTRGFTVDVEAYDRARDEAYREMARRLDTALAEGSSTVIVDAVHGEADKRAAVYALCDARGATSIVVQCRCDDPVEVARRFRVRTGREHEPPNEASDLSVFRDIARRWTEPITDRLPDGRPPIVIGYDSETGAVEGRTGKEAPAAERVLIALRDAAVHRRSLPL